VSALYGKTHGNYTGSAHKTEIISAMGEMAERGETKFGGNFDNNIQLIQIILNSK
jgi:hypothetical protein